jgi:hypothetical protein
MVVGVNLCVLFSSFPYQNCEQADEDDGEKVAGRPPKPHPPPLELDTPKYAGVIEDTMIMEKLLA